MNARSQPMIDRLSRAVRIIGWTIGFGSLAIDTLLIGSIVLTQKGYLLNG